MAGKGGKCGDQVRGEGLGRLISEKDALARLYTRVPDLESGRRPGKVRVRQEMDFLEESGAADSKHPFRLPSQRARRFFYGSLCTCLRGEGAAVPRYWLGLVTLP